MGCNVPRHWRPCFVGSQTPNSCQYHPTTRKNIQLESILQTIQIRNETALYCECSDQWVSRTNEVEYDNSIARLGILPGGIVYPYIHIFARILSSHRVFGIGDVQFRVFHWYLAHLSVAIY
jgi:hypothetical protein